MHSSAYSHSYFNFNKNCSTKITCVAIFSIPNKQSCVLYWRSKYLYFLASNTFLIWQGEKRTQGIILNNTLLLFAPIILYIICLFLWQFLMSKKLWSQGFSLLHNWWIFYSLPHKRYTWLNRCKIHPNFRGCWPRWKPQTFFKTINYIVKKCNVMVHQYIQYIECNLSRPISEP